VINAEPTDRVRLAMRWALFAVLALAASGCTPYGWESLLASRKILSLGQALPLIGEWHAADFTSLHPFEICLLGALGLALYRGITLPPMRILILLGLVHMALAQSRAAEILALLAPLVLAAPLAPQIGQSETTPPAKAARSAIFGFALVLVTATLTFVAMHRFTSSAANSPVQAVTELKKLGVGRVLNEYDFGGYLIASGVAPFIDGRTELYGEKFFLDHNNALIAPDGLFRLLEEYRIEATLLRTQSPAAQLLDHVDGWQKIYSDETATVHIRKAGASHAMEPVAR
jgi:hypothetical protein